MRKKDYIQSQKLVFRRWSRKAYAIFVSLKKEVTIAKVAKSIVEKSLSKGKSLQKNTLELFNKINIFTYEEEDNFILTEIIADLEWDNCIYTLPTEEKKENFFTYIIIKNQVITIIRYSLILFLKQIKKQNEKTK